MDRLADWQKTLLLAGLIEEWEVLGWRFDDESPVLCYDIGEGFNLLMRVFLSDASRADTHSTLYSAKNMHYAWRLVAWVNQLRGEPLWVGDISIDTRFAMWWERERVLAMSQAQAQRAWLDKVLELAVAAGVVDESKFGFLGDDDE